MTTYDTLSTEQKVRATIHRDANAICNEVGHLMGMGISRGVRDVIAELVYKKLKVYGSDLEAFARHAKRYTINCDDVKLLARRNPSLKEHISKVSAATPTDKKVKNRNTILPSVTKQPETDASRSFLLDNESDSAHCEQMPMTKEILDEAMAMDDDDSATIDLTFD